MSMKISEDKSEFSEGEISDGSGVGVREAQSKGKVLVLRAIVRERSSWDG
jgi:hypothetical protein